jgi:hypothetical protein
MVIGESLSPPRSLHLAADTVAIRDLVQNGARRGERFYNCFVPCSGQIRLDAFVAARL